MTTIVIDCASKKIVADKQTTSTCMNTKTNLWTILFTNSWGKPTGEEMIDHEHSSKIYQIREGVYAVGAGCADLTYNFIQGYKNFLELPYIPEGREARICIIRKDGESLVIHTYTTIHKKTLFGVKRHWKTETIKSTSRVIAIGSGSNYAYGALMAGVTPEEAIVAASKTCEYTSADYDVVQL